MAAHFQLKLKQKLGKHQTLRSSEHQAQNAVPEQGTCNTSLNDDNNTTGGIQFDVLTEGA